MLHKRQAGRRGARCRRQASRVCQGKVLQGPSEGLMDGEFGEHLELNPDKEQEGKELYLLVDNLSRTSSLLLPPSITSHQLPNRNSPLSPITAVQLQKHSEPAFPCTCSAIKFPTCVSPAPTPKAAGTIEQRGPKSTRLTLNSNGP